MTENPDAGEPRLHDLGGDIGAADDTAMSPTGPDPNANYSRDALAAAVDDDPTSPPPVVDETALAAGSGDPEAVRQQKNSGGP